MEVDICRVDIRFRSRDLLFLKFLGVVRVIEGCVFFGWGLDRGG